MRSKFMALTAGAHLGLSRALASGGPRLAAERGQGTVEYVGLVLMVAVLMGGIVAAVGGLDDMSSVGRELAGAITKKIIQAVQKITFSS